MKIKRYTDTNTFYSKVSSFLEKNEDVNNLALGILNKLVKNPNTYGEMKPVYFTVESENLIKLVMLMTPPYNLQLVGINDPEAVEKAIDGLISNNISIPGIIGCKELCLNFEKLWKEKTSCKSETAMDQRIYRLDTVKKVPKTEGFFKIADENEIDILTQWFIEFHDYLNEQISQESAAKSIKSLINRKRAFLWIDKGPVTMIVANRGSENGITVSGVYTPERFRRMGYATSCVAKASQYLLDQGYKYCTLYTDLSNPTSNSIYQKIGYKPIADSVMIRFN